MGTIQTVLRPVPLELMNKSKLQKLIRDNKELLIEKQQQYQSDQQWGFHLSESQRERLNEIETKIALLEELLDCFD